jgi:type I restriction enzyme S subunit
LVINTLWAWMGAMGVARQDGVVSPAYNVYRPTQAFDPDYLDYLVRTPMFVAEVTRYSKGVWSSRMRLYPEGLYEASMPVPPLDEQVRIAQHVSGQNARIDALHSATSNTVALLEERRTALIARAVMRGDCDAD